MSKVGDSIRETGDSIRTVFANKPLRAGMPGAGRFQDR